MRSSGEYPRVTVCRGTWPDRFTPCLRILVNGKCPKLHDKAHREKGHITGHQVVPVDSVVTGEIIAQYCVDCEERVD